MSGSIARATMTAIVLASFGLTADSRAQGVADASDLSPIRIYIGTYTGQGSEGIYLMELDRRTGGARVLGLAGAAENPSFVAIHPSHEYLYAVGEVSQFGFVGPDGKKVVEKAGAVHAFAINPVDGRLSPISTQSTKGDGPCHLVVDKAGKHVLVANYGGGSVAALPIHPDGALGAATSFIQHEGSSVDPGRQTSPHAHSINLDASNRHALVADLGLDQVKVYDFDAEKGTLTAHEPPFAPSEPGAGPRHLSIHPSGKFVYVCNEMASSVTAYAYDAEAGTLQAIQTESSLPGGKPVEGNSTAEVQVHPSGAFVYVSNRGHDSIAMFRVDETTGKLTSIGHQKTGGKTPRNFGIDPSGRFLLAANQSSDSIVVFKLDTATGLLKQVGQPYGVAKPVCVKFVPFDR